MLKNKEGLWKSSDAWKIKERDDIQLAYRNDRLISIENISKTKVLTTRNGKVILEAENEDNDEQLWEKGVPNNEGYFTLEFYCCNRFLTAVSSSSLENTYLTKEIWTKLNLNEVEEYNFCLEIYPYWKTKDCEENPTIHILELMVGGSTEHNYSMYYEPLTTREITYLQSKFCDLQNDYFNISSDGGNWNDCRKCLYAKHTSEKAPLEMKKSMANEFIKTLKSHFEHDNTFFFTKLKPSYIEDIVPNIIDWFQQHTQSLNPFSVCENFCSENMKK